MKIKINHLLLFIIGSVNSQSRWLCFHISIMMVIKEEH